MTPKEKMIQSLARLCAAHGVEAIADAAKLSAENLRQIARGTKLPSGEPRGVGPTIAKKLTAVYPGWDICHSTTPQQPPPADPAAVLQALAEYISRSDPERRQLLISGFTSWVSEGAPLDSIPTLVGRLAPPQSAAQETPKKAA